MSFPGDSDVIIDSTVLKAVELGTKLFKSGEYLQAKRIFINAIRVCDSYSEEQIIQIRNAYQLDTVRTVSYTHLDVYKRQGLCKHGYKGRSVINLSLLVS